MIASVFLNEINQFPLRLKMSGESTDPIRDQDEALSEGI
jgi:hypothetical protein